MKGIMRKALSLVMMLAMVATLVVVPNVDAKAAVGDFYLIGYINNADYGCESDWSNDGDYMFVNGKLTTTFSADSYVFVKEKTGDSDYNWYMTTAYVNDKQEANFVVGGNNKLFVPGGVAYTFTLTKNTDGSVNISYVAAVTAADVVAKINEIGTVELSDDSYNKIKAARSMCDAYLEIGGTTSSVSNYATLTDAEAKWEELIKADKYVGTITLYVKNENWTEMAVYVADADWEYVANAWPGTELKETELNEGWYSCALDSKEATRLIFNNNKKNGAEQTSDWNFVEAGTYWVTLSEKNSEGKYTLTDASISKVAPEGWKVEEADKIETTTPTDPNGGNKEEDKTPSTTDKYQQKYTSAQLVGNFAALKDKLKNCKITSDWDVAGDAGNMEYLGNGVYAITLTFDKTTEDVVLEYKVAFNHSWDVSIGLQSVDTAFTTNNGGNIKVTIPAGSTSFKIIASEKDTVVYDSIQNAAEVAQYEEIAKMADSSLFVLYVVILVAGCAMVAVASKKRFAR